MNYFQFSFREVVQAFVCLALVLSVFVGKVYAERSEEVGSLEQMILALSGVRSLDIQTSLMYTGKDIFSGKQKTSKSTYRGSIDLSSTLKQLHVVNFSDPSFGTLDAEIRLLNKKGYIKVNEMPPLLALFMPQFMEAEKQWVSFDINKVYKGIEDRTEIDTDGFSKEDKKRITLRVAQEAILGSMTLNSKGEKTLNKRSVEEITFTLDSYAAMKKTHKILLEEGVTTKEQYAIEEKKLDEDFRGKSPKDVAITGTIWIGSNDHLPYKLSINPTRFAQVFNKDVSKVTLEFSATSFNKGVKVSAPKGAKSFEVLSEMLSDSFSTSLGASRDSGTDASIKSTLANSRAQAELYYDSNSGYKGVCQVATTGIAKNITDLKKSSKEVGCMDSATEWVAYAKLKSKKNTYYCVDSQGRAEELTSVKDVKKNVSCDDSNEWVEVDLMY